MWPFHFFEKKPSRSGPKPVSSDLAVEHKLKHVAIIMDGNGRWAKQQGKTRIFGHTQGGVKATEHIIEACRARNIRYLTLYAFSQQNWQRSEHEVKGLMRLLEAFLKGKAKKMLQNNIQLKTIGTTEHLPKNIQDLIHELSEQTSNNTPIKMTLTLALSYGGREELIKAIQKIGKDLMQKNIELNDVDQTLVSNYLDTQGTPDPDLIIRTSGEHRTSNFLPWQATYAEYYFTDTLWPDFTSEELDLALSAFAKRERRFGLDQAIQTLRKKEHA